MRTLLLMAVFCASVLATPARGAPAREDGVKTRIVFVSSYHREYLWCQAANRGALAALLKHGYLDNPAQGQAFTRTDNVESSTAVIKKLWMDTKRQNSRAQIAQATARIVSAINAFHPDLLILGDDNATHYIGNQYIDTDLDMVFWGVNGSPLKYDLISSLDHPGHNITGVYQAGYLLAAVQSLKKLFPSIHTLAVLSDASPTGRSKARELERFANQGQLPVKLIGSVVTDSFATWKSRALALSEQADAFIVLNHNTLVDDAGHVVDQLDAGAWYLRHIHKPEVSQERQFAVEGMLSAVGDSGYIQAYAAVDLADRILAGGEKPAQVPVRPTRRGALTVNAERAKMLGVYDSLEQNPLVERWVPAALALHDRP